MTEPNCKPNYLSVMNYLFQLGGLRDDDGVAHLDYSGSVNGVLNETTLNGDPLQLPYRTAWYAPLRAGHAAGARSARRRRRSSATARAFPNPLPAGWVPMARVDAYSTLAPTDWSAGLFAGPPQDINFDGTLSADAERLERLGKSPARSDRQPAEHGRILAGHRTSRAASTSPAGIDFTGGIDFAGGLDFTGGLDYTGGLDFTGGTRLHRLVDAGGIDFGAARLHRWLDFIGRRRNRSRDGEGAGQYAGEQVQGVRDRRRVPQACAPGPGALHRVKPNWVVPDVGTVASYYVVSRRRATRSRPRASPLLDRHRGRAADDHGRSDGTAAWREVHVLHHRALRRRHVEQRVELLDDHGRQRRARGGRRQLQRGSGAALSVGARRRAEQRHRTRTARRRRCTAVLEIGPSHASAFTLNADGSFTYTPHAGFAGTDTFTYHAKGRGDRPLSGAGT